MPWGIHNRLDLGCQKDRGIDSSDDDESVDSFVMREVSEFERDVEAWYQHEMASIIGNVQSQMIANFHARLE
jgi:hypothetical protein